MKEKFLSFLSGKEITKEQFAAKSADEIAELYNEFNAKVNEDLQNSIDAKADQSTIDSLKEEIAALKDEQYKNLNEKVKDLGLELKKVKKDAEGNKESKEVSLMDSLKAVKEKLAGLKTGEVQDWISLKVAATMLSSTNISGGNVPVEQRIAGMDAIASRRITLMDVVSRGVAQSNIISWVSQANKDGAAGTTAEGALKNQIDFDLVVDSENLKKITAFIKVSDEMVDDIDFLNTEINNELMREVMKVIESQVYEGDGTGNNLNGIRTVASAFAAGTFAGTVDNANFVDVLRVAMNQIEIADQMPATAVFAHPSDVTALMLIKVTTTDKRYIDALQVVAGQLMLDGVPIIKSTLVTAGEYLVGHFPNATVWDKGQVQIEVGLDSDDFTKNLRTIRAEWRGLNIVKTNKRASFVAGVIATDAAALETA